MVEVGVSNFRGYRAYPGAPKKRVGSKPLFMFGGDLWSNDEKYKKLQNLLLDWFRGDPIESLALAGLDHNVPQQLNHFHSRRQQHDRQASVHTNRRESAEPPQEAARDVHSGRVFREGDELASTLLARVSYVGRARRIHTATFHRCKLCVALPDAEIEEHAACFGRSVHCV